MGEFEMAAGVDRREPPVSIPALRAAVLLWAATPSSPRSLWGIINQSRPTARKTPMVPVATVSPRPTTSGGSLSTHCEAPCSEGCRHTRSWAGRGAGG